MLTSRGSVEVMPMSGTSPQRLSITLSFASGAAMRMSAPSAICRPPPKQLPCTAAMTGIGRSIQSVHARWARFARWPLRCAMSSSETGPLISEAMSRPEQKLLPLPCSTTARTPGVPATSSAAARMPSNIAPSSALCLSGRFSETTATWSSTSMRTRGSSMPRDPTCLLRHRDPHAVVALLGPRAVGAGRRGPLPRRGRRGALELPVDAAVRARLRPRLAAREREPDDRAVHHPPLLEERAGVVGQPVALADLLHARRDLGVARARHVGVEVVLDLVAEVATGDVEERAALDVRRAEELAHVERAARLVLGLLLAERVGLVGEVAAEDDGVRPEVAHDVGGDVGVHRRAVGLGAALQRELRELARAPAPAQRALDAIAP